MPHALRLDHLSWRGGAIGQRRLVRPLVCALAAALAQWSDIKRTRLRANR